jgi:hypothetical protein
MIHRRSPQASLVLTLTCLSFACLTLLGCPTPNPKPDANDVTFDGGNPAPRDACSGGCAANQKCDTVKRVCVDACGGCDAGTCANVAPNTYQCRETVISCNNAACEPGQIACVGGACACLAAANSSQDSCREGGKWCNNTVCVNPKRYEQCIPGSEIAKCPTGHICDPVFGANMAICVKDCAAAGAACDRGEACATLDTGSGCLPLGLFRGQDCSQNVPLADGGLEQADGGGNKLITVPVSNTCLLKDNSGVVTDAPGKGAGNCTYNLFKFWDEGVYPFRTCRPAGSATEGQACKLDYSAGAIGTQCATGLECALTRGGDQGVCMRMCNANPPIPGFPSQPACGAAEACVNMYRYTDPNNNAVLGVCMKTCDVFDATKNTCANVGTTPTSCVPTLASGEAIVSDNGAGVCVPQQQTIAAAGANCAQTDPFKGAACGNAQLCASADLSKLAACTPVCDVECAPADGGTGPSRCATQPNAKCAAGTTCHRVTSTTGARVGFCL